MMSSSGRSAFSRLFSSIRRIASCRQPLHRSTFPRAALIRSMDIRGRDTRVKALPLQPALDEGHDLMTGPIRLPQNRRELLFDAGPQRVVLERREVDPHVQPGGPETCLRDEGGGAGVRDRVAIPLLGGDE